MKKFLKEHLSFGVNFMPCSDSHFYCVNRKKSECNILYKISINYYSIKIQLVIILRKILNTVLS